MEKLLNNAKVPQHLSHLKTSFFFFFFKEKQLTLALAWLAPPLYRTLSKCMQTNKPRIKAVIRNNRKCSKITFDTLHPRMVSTLEFPFNNPKPVHFLCSVAIFSPGLCVEFLWILYYPSQSWKMHARFVKVASPHQGWVKSKVHISLYKL